MDNGQLLKRGMDSKIVGRSARGRPMDGWREKRLNDRRMDVR